MGLGEVSNRILGACNSEDSGQPRGVERQDGSDLSLCCILKYL